MELNVYLIGLDAYVIGVGLNGRHMQRVRICIY
jgi:hypothetical protein